MFGWISPSQLLMGAAAMDNIKYVICYSRQNRNMMEKHRRDKMNAHISNLALLVPTVANSPKKMDKTSILRLTAAFLRLHKFLTADPGETIKELELPECLKTYNLSQALMEVMDGFMIIVSCTGNILFVTHTVEALLGHAQSFLMGQKLHSITFHEDHDVLNKNLTPDPDPSSADHDASGQLSVGDDSSSSGDTSSSSSQSAHSPQQQPSSNPPVTANTGHSTSPEQQRRSFYLRLSQRAVSRSEITQYELVHVLGLLRVPQRPNRGLSTHSRTRSRSRDSGNTGSGVDIDTVLIAVVRMMRERSVADRSLLEPTRDEYVTRHLLDGRIIYSDHRISVVSGYMAEEITGDSAFKFMHKDDVRFTIVALRQMYDRGKATYGRSCYRLLSKTGQFIYLRTHGYLEYDKDTQNIVSFICINTLVSEEEGMQLVQEMKSRFSVNMLSSRQQAALPAPPDGPSTSSATQNTLETDLLEGAISQLISNIPAPSESQCREDEKCPEISDIQYVKAVRYSKALPPATVQAAKVGLDPLISASRARPVSPMRPLTVTIPEAPSKIPPDSDWSAVKRESVITSLGSSVKTESVPPPPQQLPPQRHETVLVSAQMNPPRSVTDCTTGLRARVNPVLKRTSEIADCDAQNSSKRQHVSYSRRRERRPTEPPAQLQLKSSSLEEPRRTPDEQLRLLMMRESSYTSAPANSPLHGIARDCSELSALSPLSPALGGDFVAPDFQPSPGNFTVKINQTVVHSPNPSSPVAPMMYVPLNITAGNPSPGPQSPAHSSNSMLEFTPAHLLNSAHSPSSQLPTQVASFSVGVGYGSLLDSFGPPELPSPPQYTSINSCGVGRSSVMAGGEMSSMLSPGDSFSSLGTLDTDLAELLAGNTSMLLPPTGQLFDDAGLISEQPSVSEQLPLVEQRLVQTHRELGTNLQLQRRNINLIEEDMNQYPLNIASEVLRPQISQIKAQQKKQEQELMTLQQDHHNMHCNNKKLTVCRMNQDVGV
ncbi:neuronal PAS domain-containing protein 2 isoform X2 [Cryptotermes secundus]|uniref:neuronal PAS domain-containing protein 2 isoform X2 n=1 Tax=Cryptotermes secundus TaxID=105785 RepID=UPI000CD7DB0E|nr:neuronal PAS domain-containing protein 2 isoform X2 [Cryptotermes secundus]